ncbi:hypothetical protein BGE01nite_19220 [Brevifollis gellanilyticus]|uniref:Uncharacterized protein n=1 Tax=Brevifollis gellanilyticus TaxID=748831 RepID=A0A512M8E0_9BACT|nr:hypothetical protein BGE01nite_19220 [Brevifollis gellanilyticus]
MGRQDHRPSGHLRDYQQKESDLRNDGAGEIHPLPELEESKKASEERARKLEPTPASSDQNQDFARLARPAENPKVRKLEAETETHPPEKEENLGKRLARASPDQPLIPTGGKPAVPGWMEQASTWE